MLKLLRAVGGGVFGEDALAGAVADGLAFGVGGVLEDFGYFGGVFWQENFAAGGEEVFEAGPGVGEDGGAAGGGFEEADGGGPAGGDHVVAGEVEGEAGAGIEGRVLRGREMDRAGHVGGPGDAGGVLGAGDDEVFGGQGERGFVEQAHEPGLTVGGVGA